MGCLLVILEKADFIKISTISNLVFLIGMDWTKKWGEGRGAYRGKINYWTTILILAFCYYLLMLSL